MSMPISTGDSGSAQYGVSLPGGNVSGQVTVHHTVAIVLACLLGLWFLGGVVFKGVRQ